MRTVQAFLYLLMISFTVCANNKIEVVNIAIGNIHLSTEVQLSGIDLQKDLDAIYTKAGLTAKFVYLPDARAIQSVFIGQYDALDARIASLAEDTGLLKVPVPLVYIELYLFGIDDVYFEDAYDLSDIVVVARLGSKFTELIKNHKSIYLVNTPEQAAVMLMKNRAHAWLELKLIVDGLSDSYPKIKPVSPVIAQLPLYHYIHPSKSHLLPRLEAAALNIINNRNDLISPSSSNHLKLHVDGQ